MTTRFKIVAALALLASLALPQYTCAKYRAPDGRVVAAVPKDADASVYHEIREPHYALEGLDRADPGSWIVVAVYLWTVPVVLYGSRARKPRAKRVLWALEGLLVAGSVYVIVFASNNGRRASGAYLGLAALGLYTVAWLVDARRLIVEPLKQWRER